MVKKAMLAISIILIILLSTTGYLYADNNSNGNNGTFYIRARSNNGGTISPEGIQTVASGDSATYTITADSGYELSWLKVDYKIVEPFNQPTFTFTNVFSNHTIEAHFVNISNSNNSINPFNNNFIHSFNNRFESIIQKLRDWWKRIV